MPSPQVARGWIFRVTATPSLPSGVFSGKLLANIFYVSFNDGVLGRVELSGDGEAVVSNDTAFASNFFFPLDITSRSDGTIYVAEFGAGLITFLKPIAPPVGAISIGGDIGALRESGAGFTAWFIAGAMALVAGVTITTAFAWQVARRRT